MGLKKGHFSYLSNKDLINEVRLIKANAPTSRGWTMAAKMELKAELMRRKKTGTVRRDAGIMKRR